MPDSVLWNQYNKNSPLYRSPWGDYENPDDANRLLQQSATARQQQGYSQQQGVETDALAMDRQRMVNALLGGGRATVGNVPGQLGTGGKKVDPTAQFATLFGMVGGQDEETLNASGVTGGAGADYQQLYNQLSNLMSQRGGSYEQDIRQSADEASKSATARMQSRGLAGSTLVDSSNARILRDRNSALNKLNDTLLGQDIGTLTNVGVEGLKAKQRQGEFSAQMKLANSDRGMKLLQTLLGV
jgi:hypothetical protein